MAKETTIKETTAIAYRDKRGRLLPGHPGLKRPQPKRERPYIDALYKQVTVEKWQEVVDTAIEQAIDGDRYARKFLADYIVGPPVKKIQAAMDTGLIPSADIDKQFVQMLVILQQVYQTLPDSGTDDSLGEVIDGEVESSE